jgi:uncharacterized protein
MTKLEKLKEIIGKYKSAVVAFSGGVDSTFLAKVANMVLGDKVLLITATSSTYPFYELEEAKILAKKLGMRQEVITSEEIDIPGFADNPPDRCYYCKGELFTIINSIAEREKYDVVFDGSNAEDLNDYRPGRKAIKELGVVSPLCEAGLMKDEIREYSREMNLETADKPSYACLASRFPYGEHITTEKLDRVGTAELELRRLGFRQFRVRSHKDLARIELAADEMEKGWEIRNEISAVCKKAGFVFVSLDLEGYRTGAMNEEL